MSGTATLPESGRRRLVVVSNRLPLTVERRRRAFEFRRSSGGLVAALDPVLTARGGVWIGWPGIEQEEGAPAPTLPHTDAVRYRAVPLTGRDVSQYYGGFANRTLWPLFHYFVARTQIDAVTWRAYEAVNERFAEAAAAESDDEALVWVHDYQLLRVPAHLRQRAPGRRIALFLHIPFPAYDVFRILPWSRSLMRGILAADLVGVHVPNYAEHVLTCAQRLLGCEVDRAAGLVQFEGREVAVQPHPIGISAGLVEELARRAAPRRDGPAAPQEIIGLDRLDYTKGIHERLLALERLLERHPSHRGRIVFTQVVVPSRERVAEYQALKRSLDETVGRINGRFSDHGWSPIRYLFRHLEPEELAAFYRNADVALVTPLRDGMNLVAKEYAAAQVDERGVLVLSEMAGAADELQEALIVNPFDIDAVAESLHRALTMPADERRARMSALRDRVRQNTVDRWVERFLAAAEQFTTRQQPEGVAPIDRVRRRLEPWLTQRPTVALFLDYDGTLTPIAPRPEDAVLAEGMRDVLRQAARTPNLDVAIVSGRPLAQLRELVAVEGLTYVGNHGYEIEGPGVSHRVPGVERFRTALERAAADLAALGVAGARVEVKGATLSYHLRQVNDVDRVDAERRAGAILRRRRLQVSKGKRIIEGRPPLDWHKGHAVLHVLVRRHGADWPTRVRALYVGDDVTDEDAFRSLRGIGRSIRVGPLHPREGSHADYAVPDPEAVLQLLRWLAAGAFAEAVR
jgi:trehalose 6-phosphate synthase/phosphatase